MKLACSVLLVCLAAAQTEDYPRESENALQRTTPAKRLFPEDVPCGGYLWKSEHKAELHMVAIYYFFGSTDYGKGKMGLYPQSLYHAVINEQRDPPTAQVVMEGGHLKEVKIQMTAKEYQAARQCFPGN
ncbi:MAG TPA: hypothetical protein VME43_07115 [Bryobacteraceae bacterium]|nr:hypothetical protein [Bryobacteraceae bacterium]